MDSHLADFLSSVPPALTIPLLRLAPSISLSKQALHLFTWSSPSWHTSWLALASWWALCLLVDTALRRFLPFVFLLVFVLMQRRKKSRDMREAPTTEHALRNVIADLTVIQSLLPQLPTSSIPITTALRVVSILYLPYLLLSFLVSFRVICAILGTVLLTWCAPWAIVLRATAWRSAWLRWTAYKAWSVLTGSPLPPRTFSDQPTIHSLTPVQSLRFLFTIYENQRWWMGLDWTAALLPGERPSWCSATQHPLSPPNAFALPENTTIYLPDGKGGRLKRTATWKWEEPEWCVVVHKEGGGLSRVERPLPTPKEETTNSSRLLKAADRLRSTNLPQSSADSTKSTHGSSDIDISSQDSNESGEEPLTDADGWVYGDNKWEGQSNRGGMGKYTRYRRWTRVAIVFEVVENISEGAFGIQKEDSSPSTISSVPPTGSSTVTTSTSTPVPENAHDNPPDSPLRQRLKKALNTKPSE
ncbi:hypothetical protein CPC08DRAFT_662667 [Agrocybe pediades]|nr:hypothetical protein CPC08DRAFT_662667 [Agrocybe pediades]